jgi:hypothetical protein
MRKTVPDVSIPALTFLPLLVVELELIERDVRG